LTEEEDSVRFQTLLTLLYLSVLGFALGYYVLAQSTDHQFAGLHTRIDALYFTVVTAATVGYGDVHPTGQLARALVTGQIVFNLVFLGLLVSLMTTQLRERAATRRDHTSRGS
jgi:voltage-gated potassium channel Kch